MNRRDSLKALGVGSLSATLLLNGCKPDNKNATDAAPAVEEAGRQPFEVERDKKLMADKFFTDHEMAAITVLANIIIPKDERSGSASDAGVPEFIEFIVKDIPDHQVPLRGGLKWLDVQCMNRFGHSFPDCSKEQQIQIVELIAYPAKATPDMKPGVAFFNRMRDLTATGFYTSKIGVADIGYIGNTPNRWEGVPADVLKQYGLESA
jgi:hypothetical protein